MVAMLANKQWFFLKGKRKSNQGICTGMQIIGWWFSFWVVKIDKILSKVDLSALSVTNESVVIACTETPNKSSKKFYE